MLAPVARASVVAAGSAAAASIVPSSGTNSLVNIVGDFLSLSAVYDGQGVSGFFGCEPRPLWASGVDNDSAPLARAMRAGLKQAVSPLVPARQARQTRSCQLATITVPFMSLVWKVQMYE